MNGLKPVSWQKNTAQISSAEHSQPGSKAADVSKIFSLHLRQKVEAGMTKTQQHELGQQMIDARHASNSPAFR